MMTQMAPMLEMMKARMGMLGGGGGELMGMIPQLMRMANFGGGHGHRRHRRR
jgi:hypothetical protein